MNNLTRHIKNPLLQSMAVYALSDGISKAMPFLVFPIVAYFLTPAEFGLVTNFGVLCQILFAFTLLNTHTYLTVDYYKTDIEDKPKLILNILYLILTLLVIIAVVTLLLNKIIFKYTELSIRWQLYALIWVGFTAVIYIYQTKLRLDEKAKSFGIYQFVYSLIAALLTLLFVAALKWTWQGRIDSLVFTAIIIGGLGLFQLYRSGSLRSNFDKIKVKNIFLFGIPLLPHTLSFSLKGGLENIYITKYISIADNGIYSFASTLASIFSLFVVAFFSAYTPYLYKNLSAINDITNVLEKEKIKIKLIKQVRYFIIFYLVANILGYFLIKLGIEVLFKETYGEALLYLPWLLMNSFIVIFYAVFSSYVFYVRSTKTLGLITMTVAILQIVINYFTVIHFGVMGIIFTGILMNIVISVLVGIHSMKVYPMPWRYLFKPEVKSISH